MNPERSDVERGRVAYYRGDYRMALNVFKPLARNENATAKRYLGYLHLGGHAVRRIPPVRLNCGGRRVNTATCWRCARWPGFMPKAWGC